MRSRTPLCAIALCLSLPIAFLSVACGDDDPTGGGGQGGAGGAAGGEGGDGGSGGVAPGSFDTCDEPGQIQVGQDEQVFAAGTMEGANDDYRTFCADSEMQPDLSYPEVVYTLTVAEACTARLALEGQSGFNGVLSLRLGGCADADFEDEYCVNAVPSGVEFLDLHLAAGTYHVLVSDAGDGVADFTLGVACATPTCGDSVKNPGEECDDGNNEPGDGCDPNCVYEPNDPTIDTCAGAESTDGVLIDSGQLVLIPDDAPPRTTVGATESGDSTCQTGALTGPAPDHVYKFIPQSNGTLIATLGLDFDGNPYCGNGEPQFPYPFGCWDRAVHIREADCTNPGAQLACSDDQLSWWAVETASAQVVAGTEYYVFVDGYNDDEFGQGPYVLHVELL